MQLQLQLQVEYSRETAAAGAATLRPISKDASRLCLQLQTACSGIPQHRGLEELAPVGLHACTEMEIESGKDGGGDRGVGVIVDSTRRWSVLWIKWGGSGVSGHISARGRCVHTEWHTHAHVWDLSWRVWVSATLPQTAGKFTHGVHDVYTWKARVSNRRVQAAGTVGVLACKAWCCAHLFSQASSLSARTSTWSSCLKPQQSSSIDT